jgi:hypothetical protein
LPGLLADLIGADVTEGLQLPTIPDADGESMDFSSATDEVPAATASETNAIAEAAALGMAVDPVLRGVVAEGPVGIFGSGRDEVR